MASAKREGTEEKKGEAGARIENGDSDSEVMAMPAETELNNIDFDSVPGDNPYL